jgi:hypothetical protein
MNKKNLTNRIRATWTTSSSAKTTTSATPLPTPEKHLATALQRAEQAEMQLRAM